MNKSDILSGFNNHINEFFNDVTLIFPNDNDIKVAHTSLTAMRKANPKLIISIWKESIYDKYGSEIEVGNIGFFLERNYDSDLKGTDNAAMILDKINALREPVRNMGKENLAKTTTYIQNLTKLCKLYYANK